MKKATFLFMSLIMFATSLSFVSCASNGGDGDEEGGSSSNNAIVGSWKLNYTEDGCKEYLIFTSDNVMYGYWVEDGDEGCSKGTYTYEAEDGELRVRVNGYTRTMDATISGKKLTVTYSGNTETYTKCSQPKKTSYLDDLCD